MKKRLSALLLTTAMTASLLAAPAAGAELPFTDVKEGDWFREAVTFAYEQGIMSGMSATEFGPNQNLTRAQAAQLLYNYEGKPAVDYDAFNDVEQGQWYYNAVNWAAEAGVVSGMGDGIFSPNTPLNREQLVTILMNYATYKGYDTSASESLADFTDADQVSSWAVNRLEWAVAEKLVSGMGNGTVAPKGNATRAQMAAIMRNFINRFDGTVDPTEDNLTWSFSDGTLTISGTGPMKGYGEDTPPWDEYRDDIEQVVLEQGVTSIGEDAFLSCDAMTSVTIPDSVVRIGDGSFWWCDGLTSVTIPDSVTSIGVGAFRNCSGLTSVTIPDSVTSIGNLAFSSCTGLTSVTIPDSVVRIGDGAFHACEGLTSVTYPANVTDMGENVFIDCTGLTSVTVADGVTNISEGTFAGCNNLTSVTFPDGLTSIGDRAFAECRALKSATFPDSVTSIGSEAFRRTGLTSVVIPEGVTKIGTEFLWCSALTSVTIHDGVTEIGRYAFKGANALTSITIPDSVTRIGAEAFEGAGLTSVTIPDSVTSLGSGAFFNCGDLTSVKLPNGLTSIGISMFYNCGSLTTVVIPDSVTDIAFRAFDTCPALADVYYTGSEEAFNAITIGDMNEDLTSATIHYNYTGA